MTASRSRRYFAYSFAVLLGMLGAGIVYFPAAGIASIARAATNGQVTLANTSGTAWSGRGDINVALGGPPLALPGVEWQLRPAALLALELAFDVKVPGPAIAGRGVVAQSWRTTHVRDAEFTLPVSLIAARTPFLQPWGPTGSLSVLARSAEFSGQRLAVDADITGRNISTDKLGALGDYKIVATPSGEITQFTLTTLSGPLNLKGAGEIGANGAFKLNGATSINTARADDAQRARLAPLLALIGPLQPDGSVAFQWPLLGGNAQPLPSMLKPGGPRG